MFKLTIKAQLRLAFLLLAGFFLGFGALAVHRMALINQEMVDVEERMLPKIVAVGSLAVSSGQFRIAEAMHALSTDAESMGRYEAEMARLEKGILDVQAAYDAQIRQPEDRALFNAYLKDYELYLDSSRRALELSKRNENEAAARELKAVEQRFAEVNAKLAGLVDGTLGRAARRVEATNDAFETDRLLLMVLSAVVVLIALGCAVYFERTVSRPLVGLTAVMRRLAVGDLGGSVAGTDRSDELGACAQAVAATATAVRGLTADLRDLIEAARAGALTTRADPSRQAGDYAAILAGANDLIDALTRPLQEVAAVMQKLAAGDLKGRVGGAYQGDLHALKINLNRSLDALAGLLGEVAAMADGLSRGDLTRVLSGAYQGAFAGIKANLNQALTELRDTIGVLQAHAGQVAVASTETSAAAQQVAAGSSRQLATLSEVAGAVDQTAGAIGSVAASAERSRAGAAATAGLAETGKAELARLVEIVETTAAFTGRMQQITGSITRISDKTHVLALNAGIEAARAGQQGAGFGFVAQQIGRLAEDAAAAARDIEGLLGDVAGQAQRSVAVATATGAAMGRIVEAAHDADDGAQSIAAAIAQQSSAAALLAARIQDLRGDGEGNAGAAEEISVTMEELARMVHDIRTRVQRFVIA